MATLAELCRTHTALGEADVVHLQDLIGSWGLLSDLSFADLLLYAPETEQRDAPLVLLGHVRPTTGTTLYRADLVGQVFQRSRRPFIAECLAEGHIVEGSIHMGVDRDISIKVVPIRRDGRTVAALARERREPDDRPISEQERTYQKVSTASPSCSTVASSRTGTRSGSGTEPRASGTACSSSTATAVSNSPLRTPCR